MLKCAVGALCLLLPANLYAADIDLSKIVASLSRFEGNTDTTGKVAVVEVDAQGMPTVSNKNLSAILPDILPTVETDPLYNTLDTLGGTSPTFTVAKTGFTLATGKKVNLTFPADVTVASTLNVNTTGAASLFVNGAAISATNQLLAGTYIVVWDGTQWQVTGRIPNTTSVPMYEQDPTYNHVAVAAGTTSAYTAAKTGFALASGNKVAVTFGASPGANAAGATLSVNGTTATKIYYDGAEIVAGMIKANRTYEFVYDSAAPAKWVLIGELNVDANIAGGFTTGTGSAYELAAAGFKLVKGAQVTAIVNVANEASPTLDVNGTGAKAIYLAGSFSAIPAEWMKALQLYTFLYDGTRWQVSYSTPFYKITGTGNAVTDVIDLATGMLEVKKDETFLTSATLPDALEDAQIQSDWGQDNDTKADYIKNKPTIPTMPDILGSLTVEKEGTGNAVADIEYDDEGIITATMGTFLTSVTLPEILPDAETDPLYNTLDTLGGTSPTFTVAKTGFTRTTGKKVTVKFPAAVTAASTLNVNTTGAGNIFINGAAVSSTNPIRANAVHTLVWDGAQWQIIGQDTDTVTIINSIGALDVTDVLTNETDDKLVSGETFNTAMGAYVTTAADGGPNSYRITVPGFVLKTGARLIVKAHSTNNGPVALRINSLATVPVIYKHAPLEDSMFKMDNVYMLLYDEDFTGGGYTNASVFHVISAPNDILFNDPTAIMYVPEILTGTNTEGKVVSAQTFGAAIGKYVEIGGGSNNAYQATIPGFVLETGARVIGRVNVTSVDYISGATLNVNGLGAKSIYYGSRPIAEGTLQADSVYAFVYDSNAAAFNVVMSPIDPTVVAPEIADEIGALKVSDILTGTDTDDKLVSAQTFNIAMGSYVTTYNFSGNYGALVPGFQLQSGARVVAKVHSSNAANAELNVSLLGSKPLYYNGAKVTADILKADNVYTFVYDEALNSGAGGFNVVAAPGGFNVPDVPDSSLPAMPDVCGGGSATKDCALVYGDRTKGYVGNSPGSGRGFYWEIVTR
ncbi:MAG: hypothetical protein FWF97_01255 [Alphaproteobacteria bacterium]|nr:hypothetical protein [Alphaproteobacteria bacterium]